MSESAVVGEALSVAVQAGIPVLLWGSPGTGKTSVVRALGEALGWHTEVVIGSIREPSDFAGLPVVTGGAVQMAPPAWAQRLHDREEGLLLLDELTTAPPAVQAAMLRVVLERVGLRTSRSPIRFINESQAQVAFDLDVHGATNTQLRDRLGRAVLVDGHWKASRDTVTELLGMAGAQCPAPPVDG